ncbi:MAG: penicillin acylase family protein [Nocardioidaceae bacterium]
MAPVSRWLKIVSWACGVVVVVLVAGLITVVWTVHRSLPQSTGSLRLAGLSAPVKVVRDSHGIPQLYADTSGDLFFAQGYVQAQDRFFQMDFRRHLTAGTLSGMFGQDALETDMFVRTLGWRDVAKKELSLLSPSTRSYLTSFSAGVNAYLDDHNGSTLSLEYAALSLGGLDYTPHEWTAVDSLAWLKAMAWNLGSNMHDEVTRTLESVHLSRQQISELYPDYPLATNKPIVTQGAVVDGVFEQDAKHHGTRLPSRPPFPSPYASALKDAGESAAGLSELLGNGDGIGSNAWAVSGEHTASGAPILANDPHLAASMPGVWYQMGLHCNEVSEACPFDVSGFTFAGLPGVVIGHNQRIAWGFTNLNPDVEDLYLEKVDGNGHYLYNGKKLPLQTHQETFDVAGDDPVTITVRTTRHGPLVSDVDEDLATAGADAPVPDGAVGRTPDPGNGYAVALRWTALEPGRTADALFAIDRAGNWDEFRAAARDLQAPAQNLVYADVDGHIGYQAPGTIPIRRSGNGNWPSPGWDPAYDWSKSFVPYDALPSVLDPKDGYVVTANQSVIGPDYPYYLGDSFAYGYRAQRIRDLLRSKPNLTVGDMAAVQLDTHSALAKMLTPYLLSVHLPTHYYRQGPDTLRGWGFEQGPDSAAAAYFNVVWRNLLELTFGDQLPEEALPTGGSRWWAVMDNLLERPRDSFWDDVSTPKRETRDDILQQALMDARDELTRIASRNPHDWRWGHLHTLTLQNQTLGGDGSPVAFMFNRGDYELGGGPSVPDATSWDATDGYEVTSLPSMRMVIPLDDLDAARWVNSTGASGHAYSDHYTDQTDLWADGRTLPWPFNRSAVEDAAADVLTLKPKKE